MLHKEKIMASVTWFEVLMAAREFKDPFTKDDLADAAGISAGPKSSPGRIASAWLTKFARWGYVRRVGEIKGAGIRPTYQYKVTEKGAAVKLREGVDTQIKRLIETIAAFKEARGTRDEARAYKDLVDLCDETEKLRSQGTQTP